MATGLRGLRTDTNQEWVLEFCGFKYPKNDLRGKGAWCLPPKVTGKSKGEGITIVHPDTGYTEHPELMGDTRYRTSDGLNFLFSDWRKPPAPSFPAKDPLTGLQASHGTSTASVMISAKCHPNTPLANDPCADDVPCPDSFPPPPLRFANYSVPSGDFVSGVAPMAEVIPLRVANSVTLTESSASALARAIYHAIGIESETVGVISISLGYLPTTGKEGNIMLTTQKALRAARDAGIVVCAAAAQIPNCPNLDEWLFDISPAFPGRDPNTICCAACNYAHMPLDTGFYGPEVDITAPGVNIWAAESIRGKGGAVEAYSVKKTGTGTSYSTAIVAGACALWQAHHGRAWLIEEYGKPLIFDLFKKVLKDSCDKPTGWDSSRHGAGVLDVVALLTAKLPPKEDIQALRDSE